MYFNLVKEKTLKEQNKNIIIFIVHSNGVGIIQILKPLLHVSPGSSAVNGISI
jgi:hypothetical protein